MTISLQAQVGSLSRGEVSLSDSLFYCYVYVLCFIQCNIETAEILFLCHESGLQPILLLTPNGKGNSSALKFSV